MKPLITNTCALSLMLTLGLALTPNAAHAEAADAGADSAGAATPQRSSVIQADLGLAILGLGYERVLSPRFSLRATGQYNRPWYTDADLQAAAIEIRPFYFPMGHGPTGLYVAPYARLAWVRAQSEVVAPTSGLGWTAGISAGYGFSLGQRWLVRLGAGFQYWSYGLDAEPEDVGLDGPHIGLDLMIGYAL